MARPSLITTFIDYMLSLCVINRFESEKRQKKKRDLYAAKVYQLHTGDWSNLSYLTVLHQENNTSLEMLELAPLAFLAESSSPALELALT